MKTRSLLGVCAPHRSDEIGGIAVDAKEIAALADRIAEGRRSRKVMDFLAGATAA